MGLNGLRERIKGKCQRTLAVSLCRRPVKMQNKVPLISFTFDDFPRSALEIGGKILREHGVAGTYYVSLGLLDRDESVGRICSALHIREVLAQGHELGCHTFGHCDPWETEPNAFEKSIMENRSALDVLLSGKRFKTLSYPISTTPRPITKRKMGQYFSCCRTGGQCGNFGTVDLNYVRAFFIEQSRDNPIEIWNVIESNKAEMGWLVFATHDVTDRPTRFGCTPQLLEEVVCRALQSGAQILPVGQALRHVCGEETENLPVDELENR